MTMMQRVKDLEKSERQLVIGCIEVMPQPEKVLTFQWCFVV
ncbi:MAG: hypothetical protein OIN66_12750 [Candidatus Methanoperedens sp.]|nr:hypothetical protein [Candidatus Methanoperedens sp.]